jgi:hypothetical protein
MKAIRTASILHNESDHHDSPHFGKRVKLNLLRDANGDFRWYTESGEDTEVSAHYVRTACQRAYDSWGQSKAWDFRANW